MTVIGPTDPTHPPIIKHAFRLMGNRASPVCLCGHCLAGEEYSDIERALDACVTHVLDMTSVIETVTSETHATVWLSLDVLHELVEDARKLLCIQRQTSRALASLRAP